MKWNVSDKASKLHDDALIWDNHACLTLDLDDHYLPQLKRFKDSGVDMVVLNVGFDLYPWERTVLRIAHLRRWLLAQSGLYRLIESVEDIWQAKRDNKLAVAFDIEGFVAVEEHISLIQFFYDLGVRWMLIAYNINNEAGGGVHDDDSGLTDFGRGVLDEMARVGMIACCSHTGPRTAMEVFEYSDNPVILSHSNPKALKDHPRNVSDELMQACAATGGVVGINGVGIFLDDVETKTESLLQHIDYAVELIGAEHVGIGLDYTVDPSVCDLDLTELSRAYPPENEYEDGVTLVKPEQLPELTERLLGLGYNEQDIRAVLGENWVRVAERVWK